jgi:hypothetical protein
MKEIVVYVCNIFDRKPEGRENFQNLRQFWDMIEILRV